MALFSLLHSLALAAPETRSETSALLPVHATSWPGGDVVIVVSHGRGGSTVLCDTISVLGNASNESFLRRVSHAGLKPCTSSLVFLSLILCSNPRVDRFKKQEEMMKDIMGGDGLEGMGAEMGKAMMGMARQQLRSKRICLESQSKGDLSEQMVDVMYEKMDKDKNGSVSKEEFLAGAVSGLMAEQLAAKQMAKMGESMGEECKQQ